MTKIQDPDVGTVLAYCLVAAPHALSRVERLSSHRMADVRGWHGWRVNLLEVEDDIDDLVRLKVHSLPVGPGYREPTTFEFLTVLIATEN